MFVDRMNALPVRPHTVTWSRGSERLTGHIQPRVERFSDEHGDWQEAVLGCRNWTPTVAQPYDGQPSLLRYALPSALDETVEVVRFILVGLGKIAQGELGLSTIGGPISVYDVVAQERQRGPSYLLWAMALISINLGLINLLPIPLLDGGHLLFFGCEAVLRRPLPLRVREVATLVGFVMVVVLGGLALKNDVEKRWDIIVAQARELSG
jgi:regulator of sigma E protease